VFLMSSGSSSHVVACFSVERTKYLMLSKSMPERSAPQVGMGFRSKSARPLSRFFSIHSGSLFSAEMSVTTSGDTPRRAEAPAASESDQPNSYCPRLSSSGRSINTSDMTTSFSAGPNVGQVVTIPRRMGAQLLALRDGLPVERCRLPAWSGGGADVA